MSSIVLKAENVLFCEHPLLLIIRLESGNYLNSFKRICLCFFTEEHLSFCPCAFK
jgi:hypothetical protein